MKLESDTFGIPRRGVSVAGFSVDRHPARQLRLLILHLERVVGLLLLIPPGGSNQMVPQAGAEVGHADECVDNGEDDQEDGQDGECCQTPFDCLVMGGMGRLVDTDKLEEEVGEGAEIEYDDTCHADLDLSSDEEGGHQEDDDGNGNSDDGQGEFGIGLAGDDDEELHGKSEEEEEIKLQEGDVDLETRQRLLAKNPDTDNERQLRFWAYLIVKESLLHAIIGTNLLQDIPSKLLVQLPCQEAHADCGDGKYSRNGNEEGPGSVPYSELGRGVSFHDILEDHDINGRADLVDLE